MSEKAQFLGLDVIGDISFGCNFGFLAEDTDKHSYISINDSSTPAFNLVCILPWLTEVVHYWPFNIALPKHEGRTGFGGLSS